MQQEIAAAFIRTFQLTPDELAILHGTSREAPISDDFFTVLNRVQVNYNSFISIICKFNKCIGNHIFSILGKGL